MGTIGIGRANVLGIERGEGRVESIFESGVDYRLGRDFLPVSFVAVNMSSALRRWQWCEYSQHAPLSFDLSWMRSLNCALMRNS